MWIEAYISLFVGGIVVGVLCSVLFVAFYMEYQSRNAKDEEDEKEQLILINRIKRIDRRRKEFQIDISIEDEE